MGQGDFRHLALLWDRLDEVGHPFFPGIVLYLGNNILPFGDHLTAPPLCHLWLPA